MGWQAPCSCIELSTPHPLQSTPTCLRGLAGAFGILCCLPIERNPTVSFVPLRPQPSRVAGWTLGTPRVPGRPRPVARLPRPTVCYARSLGCGTLRAGVGSVTTGSVRPSNAFCPSTRTTAVSVSSPRPHGPSGIVRASASRRNATCDEDLFWLSRTLAPKGSSDRDEHGRKHSLARKRAKDREKHRRLRSLASTKAEDQGNRERLPSQPSATGGHNGVNMVLRHETDSEDANKAKKTTWPMGELAYDKALTNVAEMLTWQG